MAEGQQGGTQTFPNPLGSLVTRQGLIPLASYPIPAFTQEPLPFSSLPPRAYKIPQLSSLACWDWAVSTTQQEGIPVFQ